MARKLTKNVAVKGVWYGPAHPDNEVTDEVAEQIRPELFEGTAPRHSADPGQVDKPKARKAE